MNPRAESEMKAVWAWTGAELAERCILRCNENGFPRASHPRIHSDRIGHLQHTLDLIEADLFKGWAPKRSQFLKSVFFN